MHRFCFPEDVAGFVFAFTAEKVVTFKRKVTWDKDFLLLTSRGNSMLA
jgi:hypothetical protein